ncbi:hypothetical protein R83H12_00722 [Fibrobacteria bacterium R8-3-H12]
MSNGCPWINPTVEEDAEEYDYCVFAADSICLKGPYPYFFCPEAAKLSNECPDDFVGQYSDAASSSSSLLSSSSSLLSSSSQVVSSSSLSLCGNSEYDPVTEICLDGSKVTFALCGAHIYNSETGFCPPNIPRQPYPRCGTANNGEYDPETHFCGANGEVQEKSSSSFAHSSSSIAESSSSISLCWGIPFNPDVQFCSAQNNSLQLLCNGNQYNTSTQFCDRNVNNTADSVYAKCGGKQYVPAEQFCSNGSVIPKCEDKIYNPANSFCVDDKLYPKCNGKEYQVDIYSCNTSGGSEVIVEKFEDTRNGKEYNVVTLGSQRWMAENMNIDKDKDDNNIGKCYGDVPSNCDDYGKLYTWAEAMALPALCNEDPDAVACRYRRQGICPDGWHVPSEGEWNTLIDFVGGTAVAGRELKSETGWDAYPGAGNGWDTRGFKAIPGGFADDAISGSGKGTSGYWWTASEARDPPENSVSYVMSNATRVVTRQEDSKARAYSVRCLYGD